jgi:hypothetical protein
MGKFDSLFITDMNVVADDMINEGEAAGSALPANLSLPYGIMRQLDVPESTVFGAYSWVSPASEEVFWVHEHKHDDFDEILARHAQMAVLDVLYVAIAQRTYLRSTEAMAATIEAVRPHKQPLP